MGWMWIWWVLGIALVIAVLWLLVRGGSSQQPRHESPEEILRRRYASGEIDREEYESKLADLRK